jgi:hypothetical protein
MFPVSMLMTEETMPLTRISLRRGKPAAFRKAIRDGLYRAMRETFNVRRLIVSC